VIKVIVLIRKKAEITTEQFRHHYETVHAPLIDRLLPYYATYRRNYVDGPARGGPRDLDCDVFTELEFATESDYEAWKAALEDPDVLRQIREDEANFLVSTETRMWVVSPFASDYSANE
jgi:EthD domain